MPSQPQAPQPSAADSALFHKTSTALQRQAAERKAKVDLVGTGLNSLSHLRNPTEEQVKTALTTVANETLGSEESKSAARQYIRRLKIKSATIFKPNRPGASPRLTLEVFTGKDETAARAQGGQPVFHTSRSDLFQLGRLLRGPKPQSGDPPPPPPPIAVYENRSRAQTAWLKGAQAMAKYEAEVAQLNSLTPRSTTTRSHRVFYYSIGMDGKVVLDHEVLPNPIVMGQVAAMLDSR